jgi:hypothetical protein
LKCYDARAVLFDFTSSHSGLRYFHRGAPPLSLLSCSRQILSLQPSLMVNPDTVTTRAMSDRGEEEAGLLSNTASDIESFHHLEKSTVNPRSPSNRRSVMRSLSSTLLPLYHFRFAFRFIRYLVAIAAAVLVFGLSFAHGPRLPAKLPHPFSNKAAYRLERPKDTRIIGLIFFGRRDRASILDCYLKNNLVSSGGWLDEVVWGVNTNDTGDLAYPD